MSFDGTQLNERRSELDLSFEQASERCAVPPRLIEALESGNLDAMPGESYAIGFLRSYCRSIDIQPEGHVTALKEAFRETASAQGKPSKAPLIRTPKFALPRLNLNLSPELQAWLAVCALFALGWFAYSVVVHPEQPDQPVSAATIESRQMR